MAQVAPLKHGDDAHASRDSQLLPVNLAGQLQVKDSEPS